MYIDYSVLFVNREILNKYYQEVPTTWEELIKVGKIIKEKNEENDLIIYNGFFPGILWSLQ